MKWHWSEWGYIRTSASYWEKFEWNFDQGKGNLDRVSEEFELPKFELSM